MGIGFSLIDMLHQILKVLRGVIGAQRTNCHICRTFHIQPPPLPVPLVVCVDPLVENPLGAQGDGAACMDGAIVALPVVVQVPPEPSTPSGRIQCHACRRPSDRLICVGLIICWVQLKQQGPSKMKMNNDPSACNTSGMR